MYFHVRRWRVRDCARVSPVCVAVCSSVLQCVAVCCRMLQCVAVCCSVLQCIAVCCSVMHLHVRGRRVSDRARASEICVSVCVCAFMCLC